MLLLGGQTDVALCSLVYTSDIAVSYIANHCTIVHVVSVVQPNTRNRANSLLRPSWLRKRAHSLVGKKKPQPSSPHPTSIPAMFSHFLQHSSHITPHSLAKYIVSVCMDITNCSSETGCGLQDKPWSQVCRGAQCSPDVAKYRHAVWELFQSETKYLCNQLQPLEQVTEAHPSHY